MTNGQIKVWEDTPKQGETYGDWFASYAENGHILDIEGGFLDAKMARVYMKTKWASK